MAEELRPYTEEDMKIQQVPWLEEYLDIEKNYTELTLHKIENSSKGQNFILLKITKNCFRKPRKLVSKEIGKERLSYLVESLELEKPLCVRKRRGIGPQVSSPHSPSFSLFPCTW